ncbi:MAG: cell division FtsA domain-containing protein, partial [Bacteroidaceae bacterium]|nr:cell division FtsA domain-containing protein [Bacteroidaceae bacterium]MBQ5818163.1 cell division FtsA domain-containing protein [Bacteroidaceae bacterium]
KRDGCALVDIGAETTTVTIYTKNLMRKLCVIPLGSANITRDLQAEHISQADAETLKIHAGYKAERFGESSISSELRNNIIAARMMEILQNVYQQIKRSGENLSNAVITGGGAKLKNIELLLNDNLPGLKIRIATEPFIEFSTSSTLRVKREEISTTLLGLLKGGKDNCCQEPKQQVVMQNMFKDEEETLKKEPETPVQPEKPADGKKQQEEEIKKPKTPKKPFLSGLFGDWTKTIKDSAKDFVNNATKEEDDYTNDDEENN